MLPYLIQLLVAKPFGELEDEKSRNLRRTHKQNNIAYRQLALPFFPSLINGQVETIVDTLGSS